MEHPDAFAAQAFERIRIPASLIGNPNRADVIGEIVEEIQRQTNASLKPGVGRFQALLDTVGISVQIDDETRRTLFECSKVRNLFVHRLGRADEKFVQECPWLNLKVGDRLALTMSDYGRYSSAAIRYVLKIFYAVRASEGVNLPGLPDMPEATTIDGNAVADP